ncbi:hypothetical protein Ciccas_003857 [Cichlidogyrus casuarinus]|uniref:Sepiapterin reductase n=1 Tax=Cichlidogyrus casuarinus TaxID=1844966 RepID=A0ABD2QD66_9PLAT
MLLSKFVESVMKTCTCTGFAPSWAGRDVIAVVTGATRGFGACLSQEIVRLLCAKEETAPKSISLFLVGRNEEKLLSNKQVIEGSKPNAKTSINVFVDPTMLIDFGNASEQEMEKCIDTVAKFAKNYESNNELHLLFNNVGTVGDLDKKAHEMKNISYLDQYTRVNFTSMVIFTSMYLEKIKPVTDDKLKERLLCVVNISSLCALVPFVNMAEYCSIKAARTMFMRCLATDRDDIFCLNYGPGPLKTDMFQELLNIKDAHASKQFKQMVLDDRVINPSESARECISWLGYLDNSTPSKHGILCEEHHAGVIGMFTGSQLDYFDGKELPNPFRS